ncbi:MAG: hypothetical protein IJI37_07605 [Opitutales bacterium]|nr:hypothetical protein [Opitutales bacterium]
MPRFLPVISGFFHVLLIGVKFDNNLTVIFQLYYYSIIREFCKEAIEKRKNLCAVESQLYNVRRVKYRIALGDNAPWMAPVSGANLTAKAVKEKKRILSAIQNGFWQGRCLLAEQRGCGGRNAREPDSTEFFVIN